MVKVLVPVCWICKVTVMPAGMVNTGWPWVSHTDGAPLKTVTLAPAISLINMPSTYPNRLPSGVTNTVVAAGCVTAAPVLAIMKVRLPLGAAGVVASQKSQFWTSRRGWDGVISSELLSASPSYSALGSLGSSEAA